MHLFQIENTTVCSLACVYHCVIIHPFSSMLSYISYIIILIYWFKFLESLSYITSNKLLTLYIHF